MTTSGKTSFDLDFTEIAEEAWERAGRELRTGYDLRTARRSMNLLTIEWQNRGLDMWTFDQGTITLQQGLNTYPLPTDTIDLLDHVIRTNANQTSNQSDLTITRISISTYATIPNKLTQARPIQVWVQRGAGEVSPMYDNTGTKITLAADISAASTTLTLSSTVNLPANGYILLGSETIYYNYISGNTLNNCYRGQNNTTAVLHTANTQVYLQRLPAITVWPTPDGSTTYTFAYWRMRRIQDAGSGVETADITFRFLPALVAGLAFYIATKTPELQGRIDMLKAQYEEQFTIAAGEDREKASVRFVPRQAFIGGGSL
jgi:hypothetical protein